MIQMKCQASFSLKNTKQKIKKKSQNIICCSCEGLRNYIEALTARLGRLSLSVGWENGPEWGFKTVSFNP